MLLLRKMAEFNAPLEDLKNIYISYIRSLLEQSCVVWNTSLSFQNFQDLERIQRCAVRIILKQNNISYKKALQILDLDNLQDRRNNLCEKFATKCLKNENFSDILTKNNKTHIMKTRHANQFNVQKAHTKRLYMSAIPQMQRMLNDLT